MVVVIGVAVLDILSVIMDSIVVTLALMMMAMGREVIFIWMGTLIFPLCPIWMVLGTKSQAGWVTIWMHGALLSPGQRMTWYDLIPLR